MKIETLLEIQANKGSDGKEFTRASERERIEEQVNMIAAVIVTLF